MKETPVIEPRRKGRNGTQSMLIPSERMVADRLRAAPEGRVSNLADLRGDLAETYGSDACCPVTVQRHMVGLVRFAEEDSDEILIAIQHSHRGLLSVRAVASRTTCRTVRRRTPRRWSHRR